MIQRVHDIDTSSTRHSDPGRRSAESRTGHVKNGRGCDGSWVGPMIRFARLDERIVAREDRGRHSAGHVRGHRKAGYRRSGPPICVRPF